MTNNNSTLLYRIALIALEVMAKPNWSWKALNNHAYVRRAPLAAKTAAIIAHDRTLNCEQKRALPSYYGVNGTVGK